jgi:hypothetical protein
MKFIKWSLLVVVLLCVLSCEELINPGDVTIYVTPSVEDFIWENEIVISATATKVDDLDKIVFYIDGDEVFEDNIEPFEYTWNTATLTYEDHKVKAIAHYAEETSRDEITVFFSPCPIFSEDLDNFTGITETDIFGESVGNIDDDDWHYEPARDYTVTFGPAFPNPASTYCNIPYHLDEPEYISMIVINSDHQIIDVLYNKFFHDSGDDYAEFSTPENVSDIYRVIFHVSDDKHWHGDILVE